MIAAFKEQTVGNKYYKEAYKEGHKAFLAKGERANGMPVFVAQRHPTPSRGFQTHGAGIALECAPRSVA